ncbi:MAG TPA: hypothetical protein VFK59_07415 [Actinomycetota bacterium]|jgi:hypothetical protein|nr:hypothetical protein [Actinomycetota bacterium]
MSEKRGTGIITFAAVILSLAGLFNGINGLAAIFKKEYFVESGLLYENLQLWGWVWLILGVLQISAAYMLFGRASGGRILAIVLAAVSAVIAFATVGAHPTGSILVIAMDVLVIWGLTVRADMFVPGGIDDSPIAPRAEPSGRPFA